MKVHVQNFNDPGKKAPKKIKVVNDSSYNIKDSFTPGGCSARADYYYKRPNFRTGCGSYAGCGGGEYYKPPAYSGCGGTYKTPSSYPGCGGSDVEGGYPRSDSYPGCGGYTTPPSYQGCSGYDSGGGSSDPSNPANW